MNQLMSTLSGPSTTNDFVDPEVAKVFEDDDDDSEKPMDARQDENRNATDVSRAPSDNDTRTANSSRSQPLFDGRSQNAIMGSTVENSVNTRVQYHQMLNHRNQSFGQYDTSTTRPEASSSFDREVQTKDLAPTGQEVMTDLNSRMPFQTQASTIHMGQRTWTSHIPMNQYEQGWNGNQTQNGPNGQYNYPQTGNGGLPPQISVQAQQRDHRLWNNQYAESGTQQSQNNVFQQTTMTNVPQQGQNNEYQQMDMTNGPQQGPNSNVY